MNDKREKTQDEIDAEELITAVGVSAVVGVIGFGLWIAGAVIGGKINDVILGRK